MGFMGIFRATIAASVCLATVSGSAWATPDPAMQWGPHPSYDYRYYSGVWSKVKNHIGQYTDSDYSLLVSAADTFLNTPDPEGFLYLRTGNVDRMVLGDTWIVMWRGLQLNSTIAAKQGSSTWSTLSDGRTKQNVTTFRTGLDALKKVRPVTYSYNGLGGTVNDGKEFVGVIAQEVEQVAPFMVTSTPKKLRPTDEKETNIKQVDANAFTYMLINAVQELSEQNEQLKRIVCKDHPNDTYCVKGAGALTKR